MALLFSNQPMNATGERLQGFPRYRELIGRDLKRFLTVNLLTLIGFAPLFFGVGYAILSSSILVLIPACILGGIFAGPALSCMYDAVFRSLRDAPGGCFENYRRAYKQNFKQSLLPGVIFSLMLGFYAFMVLMLTASKRAPGFGTLAVYFFGMALFTMFFSLYWPQIALFEQSGRQRFLNCILFILRYFWKTFRCALLQILYWGVIALLFPWSVIVLVFLGVWFIVFTAGFLLYEPLNEAFAIEEQISQAFPEQAAFYETDEQWLKRRREERQ